MSKRLWSTVLVVILLINTFCLACPPPRTNAQFQNQLSQENELSQIRRKYADTFKIRGSKLGRQVALTFDDVPDPRFTPAILNILKQKGVRASFFVVGERVQKYPNLLRRISKEGHTIGNHSYTHPVLKRGTLQQFITEIRKTENAIKRITGRATRLIRPPYGEINEKQVKWAKKNRYLIVNWDVDSLDWKGLQAEKIKNNVLRSVRPGSIILLHAGGGVGSDLSGTIKALPKIIDELRKRGYRLVTLPELLG